MKVIIGIITILVLILNVIVLTNTNKIDTKGLHLNEASADIPPSMHWPTQEVCTNPPYDHWVCKTGSTGCIPTDCN